VTDQKKQIQWARIGAEGAAIIVSILVAFAIDAWWQERQEQEMGRQFTERLLSDLQNDYESRTTLVAYYQAVIDSANRTVSRLGKRSIDDPAEFVIDAYRATEYAHRPQTRAAFDEIVSSGSLGLIPAAARQAGIVDYYRYDNSLAMREAVRASPYRARVRRLIPHDVQTAIRANCSDLNNEKGEILGFKDNCELGLSRAQIEEAATILLSDQDLLPDLRYHFSVLLSTTPNFRGEVLILESTIRALKAAD